MAKRQLFGLIGMLFLLLVIFSWGVSRLTDGPGSEGIVLDEYISSEVRHSDGTVSTYDSNYFESTEKGDLIKITIPLPKDQEINPAVIFCSVYQCAVRLSYNGEMLYSYGQIGEGEWQAIGNVLVCADVPQEAWGNSLTLECFVADYSDFTKINDVTVCDAKNRTRYLLQGKAASFLLSMTVLIVFTALFFVLLMWRRGGVIRRQGICLSAFCVGLMMWQLGYDRMFYVLSDNVNFCGIAEYVGLFFAPAPFCMFLYDVEPNRLFRKAMKLYAVLLLGLFTVSTVLNFTTANWHYCRLLKIDHVLIGIIALTVLLEFLLVRCKGDNKRLLVRFGIVLYIGFAMSDMLLFYVDKTGRFHVDANVRGVTSLGLYIFLILMLISYISHALEYVVSVREKKQLERMAYQDELTNSANRRSCLDYIETLQKKQDYTVFFFDVNDLKSANDKYGHDMGDKLIQAVAKLLGAVFKEQGFFGRYGGDEFVAIVEYSRRERVQELEACILEKLDKLNGQQEFPFPVRLAYGIAYSSEVKEGDADEVVRLADERMYEKKWRMKKG